MKANGVYVRFAFTRSKINPELIRVEMKMNYMIMLSCLSSLSIPISLIRLILTFLRSQLIPETRTVTIFVNKNA